MPTYLKCPNNSEVCKLASDVMREHHQPLVTRGVRIDFLLAYPDYDDSTGEAINDALTCHGAKALGICRKTNLKDRTKGLGDAEICLDGPNWEEAPEPQRRSLLDHELQHLAVSADNDAIGRPKLTLRKHDIQFGWFLCVAKRNGQHAIERIQANSLLVVHGQILFPEIMNVAEKPSRIQNLELAKA